MLFEQYGDTPLGRELSAIIDTSDRYIEMRAFTREGYPALAALVSLLREPLEALREKDPRAFDAAKRFCGWKVGEVMRRHGHVIIRQNIPMPGGLFSVAMMWSTYYVIAAAA